MKRARKKETDGDEEGEEDRERNGHPSKKIERRMETERESAGPASMRYNWNAAPPPH